MPRIPYVDWDHVPASVRDAVQTFEQEHGRSNLRRLLANYPPALIALDHMYRPFVTTGSLGRRTKELMIVAASSTRGDRYSTTVHTKFLQKEFDLDPQMLQKLAGGDAVPELEPWDRALVGFARRAARDPRQLTDGDFEALRTLGMTPEIIMEALSVVMMSAFTNTMAIALDLPLPEEPADA